MYVCAIDVCRSDKQMMVHVSKAAEKVRIANAARALKVHTYMHTYVRIFIHANDGTNIQHRQKNMQSKCSPRPQGRKYIRIHLFIYVYVQMIVSNADGIANCSRPLKVDTHTHTHTYAYIHARVR